MEFETQQSGSGTLKKALIVVVIVVAVAVVALVVVLIMRRRAAAPINPDVPVQGQDGTGGSTLTPGQEGTTDLPGSGTGGLPQSDIPESLQGSANIHYDTAAVAVEDEPLYQDESGLVDSPFGEVPTGEVAVMTDAQKEFLDIPVEEEVEFMVVEVAGVDGATDKVVLRVAVDEDANPPGLFDTPFDEAPIDTPAFMNTEQKAYFGIPADQTVRYVVKEVTTEEGTTERAVLRVDDSTPSTRDSDDDGVSDADESRYGTDPQNPDSDDDGFTDGKEVNNGTDPLDKNSVPPIEEGPKG